MEKPDNVGQILARAHDILTAMTKKPLPCVFFWPEILSHSHAALCCLDVVAGGPDGVWSLWADDAQLAQVIQSVAAAAQVARAHPGMDWELEAERMPP